MSAKPDYDSDQWQLLLDVPPLVGTAVMMAGKSGLGTVKEAMAVAGGVVEARHDYESNQLIQSLIEARTKDKDRSSVERRDPEILAMSPEQLADFAIEQCQRACEMLEAKSPTEVGDYKEWTLKVGEKVANAAKEGGFLGIGGERVSEAEADVLKRITETLGIA